MICRCGTEGGHYMTYASNGEPRFGSRVSGIYIFARLLAPTLLGALHLWHSIYNIDYHIQLC